MKLRSSIQKNQMQKPNRYVFETELEGFINVYQDSGKYENRTFFKFINLKGKDLN